MSTMRSSSSSSVRRISPATHGLNLPTPALPADAQDHVDWFLLGRSFAARQLRSQIQRIAPYFRVALIRGEPGSGKQLVARAIHALAAPDTPFVVARASVVAESFALAEAAGSADPISSAAFLHESAGGGTLYLQGVGDLSPAHQSALFRFLLATENRRCVPPANATPNTSPERRRTQRPMQATRILASSHRDLRILSTIGQFRPDLYGCIAGVNLVVPALRQRLEDIPDLAASLVHRLAGPTSQPPKLLSAETLAELQRQSWPTNLRELESVLTHAVTLAEGLTIEPSHLLALVAPEPAPPSDDSLQLLDGVVRRHILAVLTRCGGNKLRAAEQLGISRSTLYRMLATVPA